MLKSTQIKYGDQKLLESIDQNFNNINISKKELINITACKNPFTNIQSKIRIPEGKNIIEICKLLHIDYEYLHIYINDRYIEREKYENTFPKTNDIIIIRAFVGSNGGGRKNPLETILRVAIMVVSIYIGGPLGAAVYFAGNMAVSALIPPPDAPVIPKIQTGYNTENTYSIIGTQNQILQFGTVPKIMGQARIYPPKAAMPYTEVVGRDQFIHELFCLGPGPLDKSELKIGESSIDNFNNVQYEFLIGNQASTIFYNTGSVTQDNINIKFPVYEDFKDTSVLYYAKLDSTTTPWTIRTTEENTKYIQLDLTAPNGLMYINTNGNRRGLTINYHIQVYVNGNWEYVLIGNETPGIKGYNISISGSCGVNVTTGHLTFSGSNPSMIRGSIKWEMENADKYNIRIRPTSMFSSADMDEMMSSNGDRTYDNVYLTAIRSFSEESISNRIDPNNSNIEFVALKIKANDQLNGYLDTFNLRCQAYHPIYTGNEWITGITSNPAWCYSDVLIGSSNKRAISNTRLNSSNLLEFAQACDEKGFECNGILTGKAPVREILKQIASIGRASPGMPDEKHGVIMDKEQTVPIQIFTPRNSWNYSAKRTFLDLPHALRCKFTDENSQPDEVIVYRDNYDSTNATKFENIDFAFVNNSNQAWKLGRYHLAVAQLRPEIHQIDVDFEHIVCNKGDLVGLSHDVPSIGIGWARVKSKNVVGLTVTLVLDDYVTMSGGNDYGIVIRTNTIPVSCQINYSAGSSKTITCTLAAASSSLIEVDNLLVWGELDSEYSLMIIKEIIPSNDLTATLYLVDYNSAILTADSGTIPDWDSNITFPVYENVPLPIIKEIVSDESVMYYNSGGILSNAIVVSFDIPETFGTNKPIGLEIQYRLYDDNFNSDIWQSATSYSINDKLRPSRIIDQLLEVKSIVNNFTFYNVELELLNKVVIKVFDSLLLNYINNNDIDIDGEIILEIFNSVLDSIVTNEVDNIIDNMWYRCVVDGISGGSEPSWPKLVGQTVVDNTTRWICLGIPTFGGDWEDLKGISADDAKFTIPNVETGATYKIRLRFLDKLNRRGEWVNVNHTVIGGTSIPDIPTGLSSENFINGIRFYWNDSTVMDFSHWEYRIQIESEGWQSWTRIDTTELSVLLDKDQVELYNYEATIYIELRIYDIFGNVSSASSYNAKTGLLNNYPVTFTVSTSTNTGDYTSIQSALDALSTANKQAIYIKNGTYNLSTSLIVPDVSVDIFGQSQDEVKVTATSSIVKCFKFHNLKKTIRISNLSLYMTRSTSSPGSSGGLIHIDGDASSDNKLSLYMSNINFYTKNRHNYGVFAINGLVESGKLSIKDCYFEKGCGAIKCIDYENIYIFNNYAYNLDFFAQLYNTTAQETKHIQIISNKANFNVRGIYTYKNNKCEILSNHLIWHSTVTGTTVYNKYSANGIYCDAGSYNNISNNLIEITKSTTGHTNIVGITVGGNNNKINSNTIIINNQSSAASPLWHDGISCYDLIASQIVNNVILMSKSTLFSTTSVGIHLVDNNISLRNVIQGNNIDLTYNTINDIGIKIGSSSNNNQGGDNITTNVGISISDNGSGNSITAKDV